MDENITAGSVPIATATSMRPATCLPFRHARATARARHHVHTGGHGIRLPGSGGFAHQFAVMLGPVLLALPVHSGGAVVVNVHAISADVALAGFRIFGYDRGKRNEPSAVLRPALQNRKVEQRKIIVLDHFLARAGGDFLGEELAHLGQHGQHLDFVEQALRRLHIHEELDAVGDLVQRIHVERQPHAALRAKLVDQHLGARLALDVFEQQRRAAGPLFAAWAPL